MLYINGIERGTSIISYEDALSNMEDYENNFHLGFYVYIDDSMYCAMENTWKRLEGGNTILGKWENMLIYNGFKENTIREYFQNYSIKQSYTQDYVPNNSDDNNPTYSGTFILKPDNNITIEIQLEDNEIFHKNYKYYLVNNYNTLIFDPCLKVE